MKRQSAILGLGSRGRAWGRTLHGAGWFVVGFDPDPAVQEVSDMVPGMKREPTISATVRGADWVITCLPDRLELMRKVIQRAQAEAPEGAVIAVASPTHGIDDIQGCALRPASVIRVEANSEGGYGIDVSRKTDPATRSEAVSVLTALASGDDCLAEVTDHSESA